MRLDCVKVIVYWNVCGTITRNLASEGRIYNIAKTILFVVLSLDKRSTTTRGTSCENEGETQEI